MLHYNIETLKKFLSSVPGLLLTSGASLFFFSLMQIKLPVTVLEQLIPLQLSFNPQAGQAILSAWGDSNRQILLQWFWVDYCFPVSYGLFLFGLLNRLWRVLGEKRPRWFLMLLSLPLAAAACDFIENSLHIVALLSYPKMLPAALWGASLAAAVKWGTLSLVIMMLLMGLINSWMGVKDHE